ncbi:type II toxin-antitoxin system PemK/MazF family toxin [Azospirillum isscasi]|uniref:Type II toxin-antitoxin system PemK/MazF family toxin n=1 Tax=Azospirillum isscasi TaxID=3053926 RepID=A0ABU0WP56_9PROT|nr:type II toxin-antitoxin system PemK/MazF family toxin [Azospirillum isscasi]MDQ2106023.1 type II toxin-antitoxin system PemK/MazF family toxin [Azospirillum isscasi]
MTAIPFGTIVLTDFLFTDLSAHKRRPALVVSRDNDRRTDVIVAYITSVPRIEPDAVPMMPSPSNGLRVPSLVRFDKLATIDKSIIAGRLGEADAEWLQLHQGVFFGVFGFTNQKY